MRRNKGPFNNWYEKPPKPQPAPGKGIRGGGNYGLTWWGKQWLEAFNGISDPNRLPRGRAYANKGAVRDIAIHENVICAHVQGTFAYTVDIEIPAFTQAQQQTIGRLVKGDPVLLARLLNRELPAEVYEVCRREGIPIFPRSWRDFKASCSCPDQAMPCKHLAAVLYLVANEIDKNPFLIFDLHRFDLAGYLREDGGGAVELQPQATPRMADLWQPIDANDAAPEFTADPDLLEALDLSVVPDCREQLLAILPGQPMFYPEGDFKSVLKKAWSNLARAEHVVVPAEAPAYSYARAEIAEISVDETGALTAFRFWDADEEPLFSGNSLPELKHWLAGLPAGRLSGMPDELRGLWLAWRLAETLVRRGALVPQVLRLESGACVVRWLPALVNETVQAVFARFAALLPPGLLVCRRPGGLLEPLPSDYPQALLSVFLNDLVREHHGLDAALLERPVIRLFFSGQTVVFDRFENREYPPAIALWLGRLFMSEKSLVPVLVVEDRADEIFEVSLAVEDRRAALPEPIPLRALFDEDRYEAERMEVLRDLDLLAEFFPALRRLMSGRGRQPLRYLADDFSRVLLETLPVIRLLGLRVLLPKTLARLLRPRLSLRLESTDDTKVLTNSGVGLQQMLAYRWQVAIGDHTLGEEQFLALVEKNRGLVKFRDGYVLLDDKETLALTGRLAHPPALNGSELLQAALSERYEGARVRLSEGLRRQIEGLLQTDLLPLPEGLEAQLRAYQHRGYSWLCKNARLGFGSILADDMGLGKTLQVIATLLHLKESGRISGARRALVVAPTTLLTNWQREVARFAPGLSTAVYHGPGRSLHPDGLADVVLTSYGVARTDLDQLRNIPWFALVIDEAQNIKNPGADQTRAIKKIQAPVRIAMSGTPVENRLSEYWSIFDFSNHDYLGSLKQFRTDFAIPIEGERDRDALERFRKLTRPFVLRRLKTDRSIISDLPEKLEQDQFCHLAPQQAALYQGVVDATMEKIERSEGIERRGLVLSLIMALKQICNHPAQYLKKGAADPELSGKAPLLLDLLEQALENDEKVLIFTQFREMGELLVPMVRRRFGLEMPFLHGGVGRAARDRMVEDFQTQPSERLLLLSLKAGGTGLNLTAASQVMHYDLWWNPAVEAQATDRAFRIGQHRNVQVHRFITAATFEERIDAMIRQKKELANLTVGSGEMWIGELSNKELRGLFKLG